MLVQAIEAIWYGNRHLVIDTYSDVILMVKLIQETEIFQIQLSHDSVEGSEFVNLFAKRSVIIDAGV